MARSAAQSALRYPLTAALGTDANVRVLRELSRHGSELAAPDLVRRTGLAASSAHAALDALQRIGLVVGLGSNRSRLFRLRRDYVLGEAVRALFFEEESRFEAILGEVAQAAASGGTDVLAAWLYGSVARGEDRPGSDVDVVVVVEGDASTVAETMETRLRVPEDALRFHASPVVITLQDAVRLDAAGDQWWSNVLGQAKVLFGIDPDELMRRVRAMRRQSQAERR